MLLKIPVVDWLIALGGGFVLAAKGLSVLSFGLINFGKLVTGVYLTELVNFGKKLVAAAQLTRHFTRGS